MLWGVSALEANIFKANYVGFDGPCKQVIPKWDILDICWVSLSDCGVKPFSRILYAQKCKKTQQSKQNMKTWK